MKIKERNKKIIKMHIQGFKTQFIADTFEMKVDTIRWIIRLNCKEHKHTN